VLLQFSAELQIRIISSFGKNKVVENSNVVVKKYSFYYNFVLLLGVLVSPCQKLQMMGDCLFTTT